MQASSPSSGSLNNSTSASSDPPPLPPRSDEAVCALYYLALLTAIIVAVLCALGRQWVRKLGMMPDVIGWKARTLYHVERMERAEKWIKVLMEVIYRLLLLSIGLFLAGLLYQLWNLASSFEETATILMATWALGVILVAGILITMIATTFHAIRYEGSVFEGPLSKLVVAFIMRHSRPEASEASTQSKPFRHFEGGRGCEHRSHHIELCDWECPLEESREAVEPLRLRPSRWLKEMPMGVRAKAVLVERMWQRTKRWIQSLRIQVERDSMDKLADIYFRRIADAGDPHLLERAVPSFSCATWVQHGDGSLDQFRKAYNRLKATDLSLRARETLNVQVSRFSSWLQVRRKEFETSRARRRHDEGHFGSILGQSEEAYDEAEEDRRTVELTKFLLGQYRQDIYSFFDSSYVETCTDILDILTCPFDSDELVAKCLCIFDQPKYLGNHEDIFRYAVNHCIACLRSEGEDTVRRILSHVDRYSVIISFIRSTYYSDDFDDILKVVIGGYSNDVLIHVNNYLDEPRGWSNIDPRSLSSVIRLTTGLPSRFPSGIDFSPIIAHLCQYPEKNSWRTASDALVDYLKRHNISTLSNHAGVYMFLSHCVDREFPLRGADARYYCASEESRRIARNLLIRYDALFRRYQPPPILRSQPPQSPRPDDSSPSFPLPEDESTLFQLQIDRLINQGHRQGSLEDARNILNDGHPEPTDILLGPAEIRFASLRMPGHSRSGPDLPNGPPRQHELNITFGSQGPHIIFERVAED
ncbi:hypothetical protein SISSUDRAFT_666946 [Sistotremastrum suecicum HHB10207 ss-3]|uniref:DUF6535 domain-containing protein n=1 Tax=Sistotremastrum suecicum HHB10207 ss-3 TaxID=1314776 RepID=A0A166E456_9AGAM|nr:hypothetical protein SISSUDRAFT_666946 [Sistotremastrum suecicum HHB10207 ss-3]